MALLSPAGTRAAVVNSTWVSGNNGNWSDPANWSNSPAAATYPHNGNLGHLYNVTLNAGTAVLDVRANVSSLSIDGANIVPPATAVAPGTNLLSAQEFTFSAGRLMVPATATANGHFTLTNPAGTKILGGTLTILGKGGMSGTSGAYVISASGTNAAIVQAGFFDIDRPLTLDVQTGGAGVFTNSRNLAQFAGASLVLSGWTFVNSGTMSVASSFDLSGGDFSTTNTFTLGTSGAAVTLRPRAGTISGTVSLAAGTILSLNAGTTRLSNVLFTNAGTIRFAADVRVATSTNIPGTVTATSGARLFLDDTLNLTGPATIDGAVIVGPGTLAVSNATFISGRLTGGAALEANPSGTLALAGSGGGSRLLEGATLTFMGTGNWSTGSLTSSSSATNLVQIARGTLNILPSASASLDRTFNPVPAVFDRLDNDHLIHVDHSRLSIGSSWRLDNSGTIRVTAGLLIVASQGVTNGGVIDLRSGGALIFDDSTTFASARAMILAGFNGGAWTGPGIRSDDAQTDPSTAVGYATAQDFKVTTWRGVAVTDVDVLVAHTKYGDANLDGAVDFADLVLLAQNYNQPSNRFWANGDFTYDGAVNFADLTKLAQNYNSRMPADAIPGASAAFSSDVERAFATVPEPATHWLLAAVAATSMARRRRRSSRGHIRRHVEPPERVGDQRHHRQRQDG
jgi:hypothetical protein